MKKGIVLKCQGNPVSCYGKRSSINERKQYFESDQNSVSEEKHDETFKNLALDCIAGKRQSCKRFKKIIANVDK